MKNKVVVIIPVHNRLEFTKKCLRSLEKQAYRSFEVILVDDGSTDRTSSFYTKHYPQWKLIKGSGNWWWTKSMHEGVKMALKTTKKGDYILTMNNDCFFNRNYLTNIVKASKDNKRAIVGSLIVYATKPTKVLDAGVRINWKDNLIYGVASTISDQLKFYADRKIIKNIDTLPGKGTLVPVEVFYKIGNFNYKRLPHYIADYEFFCRAKRRGFNLIVSSESKLYNFALQTGHAHLANPRLGYGQMLYLMFGRKSKLNILDHLNFILLCCPRKHLPSNIKHVSKKFSNYIFRIFPFCYLPIPLSLFKLVIHNIPIYVRQNPIISKIREHVFDKKPEEIK